MRVLVAFVAIALVGLAVGAPSAFAGSKKPGSSISVDLGPASVKVDASSGGADASVDVSTPAATVDASVDSSAQTPVSATVTSTPVAGATVDVADSTDATVSTPAGSTTVHADTKKGVQAQVKSPVASGKTVVLVKPKPAQVEADTKFSAQTGSAPTAPHAASAGDSDAGSRAVAVPASGPAKPAAPRHITRPAAHKTRTAPALPVHRARVTADPRNTGVAAHVSTPSPVTTAPPALSLPAAGHAPGAASSASVTASSLRAPAAAPTTSGAGGSGLSAAGFFAILTAFLMLVAPIVGRWLRPTIGLALQPAFASFSERPG